MASIIRAIEKRRSVRTYDDTSLSNEEKRRIEKVIEKPLSCPFGNKSRFCTIDMSEIDKREARGLGTYGFIKGATLFIIGAAEKHHRALEDFGYHLEKIILELTVMGFGTCWMGGTFNRANFARRISIRENELLPAITPVGYPLNRRSLRENLIRLAASARKRKPWEGLFSLGDVEHPLERESAGRYQIPLEMVRIGPSASNRQPWRIVKEQTGEVFHFYLRRTKGYGKIVPEVSLQNIDMGIAMCHFEFSAGELGLNGRWIEREPEDKPPGMEYIVSWVG